MKRLLVFALVIAACSSHANPLIPEFSIVPKNDFILIQSVADNIIFETPTDYILKSTLTDFASNDYYYIQLPPSTSRQQWFFNNTQVVFDKPGEYLIAKISNKNQLEAVANKAHHEGHACGMIQKLFPQAIALQKKSAPVVVRTKLASVTQAVSRVNQDSVMGFIKEMVSWRTRYHDNSQGIKTGEDLKAIYQQWIPSDRNDVTIDLIEHEGSRQRSLRVRITGEQNPEQIVVIGSHIDSINNNDNSNAPGADDNASGTAVNLEAFKVLMTEGYFPKKTIEIHGYAAEEIGLVGSGEMAESYRQQNKQVVSMVQMDMSGYTESNPKVTFVSNGTDSSLTSQLRELVSQYLEIPSTSGFLLFGSSDHASWDRKGFPVAFPTEDPFNFNQSIHTSGDTIDQINSPKQITEFSKLAVAYLMHFSM